MKTEKTQNHFFLLTSQIIPSAPNWVSWALLFSWVIFGSYLFGYCWCTVYFFWVISNWKYGNVILEWLYWAKMAFSTKPCLICNVHCCNSKKELKANQVNGRHSDRNPHCKYIHCKNYIMYFHASQFPFHCNFTVIEKLPTVKKMYFFRIQQKTENKNDAWINAILNIFSKQILQYF